MSYLTVLTGPARRRRWSEEDQCRIMAASFAPAPQRNSVARQTDIDLTIDVIPFRSVPEFEHQLLKIIAPLRSIFEPGQEVERFAEFAAVMQAPSHRR